MKKLVFLFLLVSIFLGAYTVSFTGKWQTNWGPMELVVEGDKITGTYGGDFPGRLEGIVKRNRAVFKWFGDNGEEGRGYFVLSEDGNSFKGMWGSGNSDTNGGPWNGERVNKNSSDRSRER